MTNTQTLTGKNWTIYQGEWASALGSVGPIDALVSDPPYGIGIIHRKTGTVGGAGKGGSIGGQSRRDRMRGKFIRNVVYKPVHGDDKPFDPQPLLGLAPKIVLWGANHYADKLPCSSCWFIWDKRTGLGSNNFADCEMAWCNVQAPARLFHHRWYGYHRDSEREEHYHPTQKPVELMRWVLGWLGLPKGSLVCDPYMGGGSTGIAAIQLGLRFVGCDIEPDYCLRAANRLRNQESLDAMQIFPEPQGSRDAAQDQWKAMQIFPECA